MTDLKALDASIMDAHEREDLHALASLYGQAGAIMEAEQDIDAACFLYTQAYIFSLQAGLPDAQRLKNILHGYGRETED
ncbi:hypothetical protein [Coralliovum pocilloporae]|uniref:hypothetical protein n=1 Tax=Coralliovum pocilloporae TaxID=3066369 RepID=UPI0033075187